MTLIIMTVAFAASLLTFYSGFGLGTLLMPVVALFFPLELAVAMTAVVHLLNNLFKVLLVGSKARLEVVLYFGLPALLAAFAGAWLLLLLADLPGWLSYEAFGRQFEISALKLLLGFIIFSFALLELSPRFAALSVAPKFLPLGGLLSGFFGGLSGHQGALRSMFLIKAGLDKESYVASAVLIAVLVDLSRLSIYGTTFLAEAESLDWTLIAATCLSAFAGAWLGRKLLQKITIHFVQLVVSVLLVLVALGLMSGLL